VAHSQIRGERFLKISKVLRGAEAGLVLQGQLRFGQVDLSLPGSVQLRIDVAAANAKVDFLSQVCDQGRSNYM
jgi:hypothetical protein